MKGVVEQDGIAPSTESLHNANFYAIDCQTQVEMSGWLSEFVDSTFQPDVSATTDAQRRSKNTP